MIGMNDTAPSGEKRLVKLEVINEVPVKLLAFSEKKEFVGYLLFTVIQFQKSKLFGAKKEKLATIWHIYVDDNFRRKSYGSMLLNALKQHHNVIETGVTTPEGAKLLAANGFKCGDQTWSWER